MTGAAAEPWRLRCPQGHTSITLGEMEGFRCTSCEETYHGDPIDIKDVDEFPVERDTVYYESEPVILERIVRNCKQNTRVYARARELTSESVYRIIGHLRRLREKRLIEKAPRGQGWTPTEAGRQAVAGGDD
jgi:hypothetical protein